MKINVIGVPLNLGCDREGVERAPNHLRERGLMQVIRKNGHRAFDLGNLYVPLVSEADKFARSKSMKYLDAIVEVNNNLAELVYDTLRGGAFPLVIGGDHSLGLGSASGVGKSFDDFGIIWLDAHGDLNTNETSPSGNIHGMPLSALMGMGSEELVNIYGQGNKVNPQNVFLVGTRSLDEGELALIDREHLSVYTMETIRLKGIGFVAEDIKRKLKERKIRNVHFSIDVDSIDPRFAPGTGTRVSEGLIPDEFKDFVEHMLSTNLIKSMDLVELNPDLDTNDLTTNLCLDILYYITSRILPHCLKYKKKGAASAKRCGTFLVNLETTFYLAWKPLSSLPRKEVLGRLEFLFFLSSSQSMVEVDDTLYFVEAVSRLGKFGLQQ